jgi:AcrR family transcriptional regulator
MDNIKRPWILIGYDIFSKDGKNGLKVEVIARLAKKSKSSFYHHFAEMDLFIEDLLAYQVFKRISLQRLAQTRRDYDTRGDDFGRHCTRLVRRSLRRFTRSSTLWRGSDIVGGWFGFAHCLYLGEWKVGKSAFRCLKTVFILRGPKIANA